MCFNRSLTDKINRLHERCLRIVYNDKESNFEELLERDGSVSFHHQNITYLAIEMIKVFKGISPQIVKEIFQFRVSALPIKKRQNFKSHLYIVFLVAQIV